MLRVFRVMMRDADGQPTIADDAGLGVRLGIDIRRGALGNAIIENKGMSVFEHWKDLPFNRKPKRLGGRGDDASFCFRLGSKPASRIAFLRGRIWSEKDEPKVALLFFNHAAKLDPENDEYGAWALDSLVRAYPALGQKRGS